MRAPLAVFPVPLSVPGQQGEFWRCTMIEVETRLRVGRGMGKTETEASIELLRQLKRRGQPDVPPPLVSDGWGGHRGP